MVDSSTRKRKYLQMIKDTVFISSISCHHPNSDMMPFKLIDRPFLSNSLYKSLMILLTSYQKGRKQVSKRVRASEQERNKRRKEAALI